MAFLDEVFEASRAILNTLLRTPNGRTFGHGGGVSRPVPLRLRVAASNEWPSAFQDRKLVRLVARARTLIGTGLSVAAQK